MDVQIVLTSISWWAWFEHVLKECPTKTIKGNYVKYSSQSNKLSIINGNCCQLSGKQFVGSIEKSKMVRILSWFLMLVSIF
jgi:hypothetical protein